VDFCGACHRTRRDIMQVGLRGLVTIRFPAFRSARKPLLAIGWRCTRHLRRLSRPTQSLVGGLPPSYDKKCLACHALAGVSTKPKTIPARPVQSQETCV